jgi:hypothetical protein
MSELQAIYRHDTDYAANNNIAPNNGDGNMETTRLVEAKLRLQMDTQGQGTTQDLRMKQTDDNAGIVKGFPTK